jgi:two-component system response regulator GlrR
MSNLKTLRKRSTPHISRDVINVMGDVFRPEQLQELIACLEEDGHDCHVFYGSEKLRDALSNARNKLLLLGASAGELPGLVEAIAANTNATRDVPVLVYYRNPSGEMQDLLFPEIDDFFFEPINIGGLRLRVNRLLQQYAEVPDEGALAKIGLLSHFGLKQFIGQSPSFMEVINKIPRVASCDATALLLGDTGTGKEMCARAIHYLSARAPRQFIPVNCGSIPENLFENELFGHASGAYTDARRQSNGMIAEAEGGTLFLDEVDSLAQGSQVKLLRFLQDQQYRPLGSSSHRQANVRVIAASNANLQLKVQEKLFREDLFYRLKVVLLSLPPLCERPEDILSLADHFLKTAAREYERPAMTFSVAAIQALTSYDWPGNIRELENVARQAVVLAQSRIIDVNDLKLSQDAPGHLPVMAAPFKIAKARTIESFERAYLTEALSAAGGNISQAARKAKQNRRAFFALLKKHALTTLHPPQEHLAIMEPARIIRSAAASVG